MEDKQLKEIALTYIREHNTMTLATANNGIPWATSLFYVSDGLTLYFLSDPATKHSMNITANPLVAATINEDYRDWKLIKGIQMDGKVELVLEENEIARIVVEYAKKYPFVTKYLKTIITSFPKAVRLIDKILAKLPFTPNFSTPISAKFYKLTPQRIYFIDNEGGFGKRKELAI
jgi:uncharacterized protein YhbP (UPF0306 family)